MKLYTILLNLAKRIKTAFSRLTTLEIWQSDVVDYIVEESTSGIWTYRKWSSGIAECWGTNKVVVVTRTAWGSIYQTSPNNIGGDAYPANLFIDIPEVWLDLDWQEAACIPFSSAKGTAANAPTYGAIRGTISAAAGFWVKYNIYAKGLWK